MSASSGGVAWDTTSHVAAPRSEPSTFSRLYEDHRPALYRFCLARTGDPDVAEDVVQDTFLRAFARFDRFDRARPFWPWLAAIAARECIDVHRRRAATQSRVDRAAQAAAPPASDPTAAAVLAEIGHAGLAHQVARLPTRQAAALQLFAVDGWSCAEIAGYLGDSVGAVKMLLVRARSRLRDVVEHSLGGVVVGARVLRARVERLVGRAQALAAVAGESWGSWAASAVAAGAPVVTALVVGLAVLLPTAPGPSAAAPGQAPSARSARPVGNGPVGPDVVEVDEPRSDRDVVRWREPPLRSYQGTIERAAVEATAPVLEPESEVRPEDALATNVTVSPSYEEDRTVFVSSRVSHSLLFVTRDGGASWTRLPARGFAGGARLLLPPGYPRDPRVFSLGIQGLQVSRDGGQTFQTLVHGGGLGAAGGVVAFVDAVLSPDFDGGDPTILLVGGGMLFEYRDDTGEVQPLPLEGLGENASHDVVELVRHAPGYPADPTILVGSTRVAPGPADQSWSVSTSRFSVARCTRSASKASALPVPAGVPALRCERADVAASSSGRMRQLATAAAPGGTGTVFSYNGLLQVSLDGGRTFRDRSPYSLSLVEHVVPVPAAGGGSALVALFKGGPEQAPLLRTDDGGLTWAPIAVGLPGFEWGARAVEATPTGRMVAVGIRGIACSADGGRTWGVTCPTPDTA